MDLLKDHFKYLNGNIESGEKVNIIDVGVGNYYPVKKFIGKFNKLGKVNKYIALDISEQLLHVSKSNFIKWFPLVEFINLIIDIESKVVLFPKFYSKIKLALRLTTQQKYFCT
ncbi:MAG: hypothetical protein V7K89_08565 [Nostoc sp.]|uniref:L-histidine N(alpha)-methyltransferase n=1 Tax=Nostoc sp. TaxID=1180 RepID=UPI002FFABE83